MALAWTGKKTCDVAFMGVPGRPPGFAVALQQLLPGQALRWHKLQLRGDHGLATAGADGQNIAGRSSAGRRRGSLPPLG